MTTRIALKQFNATVGDIDKNTQAVLAGCKEAEGLGADIAVFPELCICGYPPEDLLLKRHFLAENLKAVERVASSCTSVVAMVGFAYGENGKSYNAMALTRGGKIEHIYKKTLLPNYGVFDEKRYFAAGEGVGCVEIEGISIALTICEDIWEPCGFDKIKEGVKQNLIVNISASPYHFGKIVERKKVLSDCAKAANCAVAYCNLVGGQDELVFDGRSMIVNAAGEVLGQAGAFEDDILVADLNVADGKLDIEVVRPAKESQEPTLCDEAEVYQALVVGTRDYVRKNNFKKVLLGLSGGIDSSLAVAIAVEALGAENVIGVTMPSRFNSAETISDAEAIAKNLGIEFHTIPIADTLGSFDGSLNVIPGWDNKSIAYENLQARIRGTMLMSISNCFGYMVLTTGNKSETAVGYSTLYGDTAGGFAVIKDVPKTMVYKLSEFVNVRHGREVIPESVIIRPPSAELRDGQKDSDSLPDYDLLDEIIKGYIEQDKSLAELSQESLAGDVVKRIINLVDRNEYKRRQSPPGVKITPKAFGKDRRMPITNGFNL